MSKIKSAEFFIAELKYEGAGRSDIIETLMGEFGLSKNTASTYIYNFSKKAR